MDHVGVVLHGARFDSSRRFSGFCGSPRGFYRLFDNFIGDSAKRASRGFCAVAPIAAYMRGLIRAFIRRFKRLFMAPWVFVRLLCKNAFMWLLGAFCGVLWRVARLSVL